MLNLKARVKSIGTVEFVECFIFLFRSTIICFCKSIFVLYFYKFAFFINLYCFCLKLLFDLSDRNVQKNPIFCVLFRCSLCNYKYSGNVKQFRIPGATIGKKFQQPSNLKDFLL